MRNVPKSLIGAIYTHQVKIGDDGYWYAIHDRGGMRQMCSRPFNSGLDAYKALVTVSDRGVILAND